MVQHLARITALIVASFATQADACSCVGVQSLEEGFAQHQNVLHGRIATLAEVASPKLPHQVQQRGTVEVIEVFKRLPSLPNEVPFVLPDPNDSCEFALPKGAMVLLFFNGATITSADLHACSPSRIAPVGDPQVERLRQITSGNES
jgi:hypothetical protein